MKTQRHRPNEDGAGAATQEPMRHLTSLKRGSALLAALAVLSGCDRGLAGPELPWDVEPVALTSAADFPGGIEGVMLADPRPSPIFFMDGGEKILDAVEVTVRVDAKVFADGGKGWTFSTSVRMTGGAGNDYIVDPRDDPASSIDPKGDPAAGQSGTYLVVIAVPVDKATAKALAAEGKTAEVELAVELYRQDDRGTPKLIDQAEAAGFIMDMD